MKMPAPDKQILSRRRQIVGDLEAIIASAGGIGLDRRQRNLRPNLT